MAAQRVEAIVIGGSAGALEALSAIIPALPRGFPIPVAIVLHLPPTKPSHLPEVIGARCALRVSEPDDKEPIEPGRGYVAAPNYHLMITEAREFSLSVDGLVHFSRPAIDVLFETAAEAYGASLLGVLLSGANEDGARGIAAIKRANGRTVVQSPETSQVPTMPDSALRLDPTATVLPLREIGPYLAQQAAVKEAV
jgi:two-component system, chemotaxis family, protein-glutamate methylesterase/glutaminase